MLVMIKCTHSIDTVMLQCLMITTFAIQKTAYPIYYAYCYLSRMGSTMWDISKGLSTMTDEMHLSSGVSFYYNNHISSALKHMIPLYYVWTFCNLWFCQSLEFVLYIFHNFLCEGWTPCLYTGKVSLRWETCQTQLKGTEHVAWHKVTELRFSKQK